MKKLILFLLVLAPALAFAQNESKYLAGAVPMINGKVVFNGEIPAPGLSGEQVYEKMLQWAGERFRRDEANENWGGMLKANPDSLLIHCIGQEYITFSKSAFSLDRALMQYLVTIRCYPGKCIMRISTVSYNYPEGTKERRTAEDWITDKQALNKDKTKLTGIAKKFRIKTVDLVEALFQGAARALGSTALPGNISGTLRNSPLNAAANPASGAGNAGTEKTSPAGAAGSVSPAAQKPAAPAAVSAPGVPAEPDKKYKRVQVSQIPGNLFEILSGDKLTIAIGYDDPFNQTIMSAAWGGIGSIAGAPVTFCFISPEAPFQLVEKAETYALRFHRNRDPKPWLILECKKKAARSLEYPGQTGLLHLYIGEITGAYMQ